MARSRIVTIPRLCKLTHTIAALSKKVDALPGTEDASVKEESETTPKSNRTNAALTRQKKKD